MTYKYREFAQNPTQAFNNAEAGKDVYIERKGQLFKLTCPKTRYDAVHATALAPKVVLSEAAVKHIKEDPEFQPRYPSSTVATGMTAKQKKMAKLKEQRLQREAARLSHLNDNGITYDPIPE